MAQPKTSTPLRGLLVVDKPVGWSSMDVVRRVRCAAGGVKTGHAGTLDPLATGVVVCCLGQATKCVERLMGLTKVYEAEVDLSAFTTTDDLEGEREQVTPGGGEQASPPAQSDVASALERFVGLIQQKPPVFSAVHINGRRAYKLARKGETVETRPRTVRIDSIEMLAFNWPIVSLRIVCGRGTYIRSIARDLGVQLNTGGHVAALRRTAVGPYTLDQAFNEHRLREPIGQEDLLEMPGE